MQPTPTAAQLNGNGIVGNFESRVKIPRYRELYALPLPDSASVDPTMRGRRSPTPNLNTNNNLLSPPTPADSRSPDDDNSSWDADIAEDQLQDVLARFERHEEEKQRDDGFIHDRPLSRHASLELKMKDYSGMKHHRRRSSELHGDVEEEEEGSRSRPPPPPPPPPTDNGGGFVMQNAEASKSRVTFRDDIDVIDNGHDGVVLTVDSDAASDRSFYPDDNQTAGRKTMYMFDHPNDSRPSLHQPSMYWGDEDDGEQPSSRRSVLDPGKSEQARQKFLKRIGDMYEKESGREKGGAGSGSRFGFGHDEIPPVPKLKPARSIARRAPEPQKPEWF